MNTKLQCGDLFVSGSSGDCGMALSADQVFMIKPRSRGRIFLSKESPPGNEALKELRDFPEDIQLAFRSIRETTNLPIFSRRFEDSGFAIMRHAHDNGPNLDHWSMEQCEAVVEKFVQKLNGQEVVVCFNLLVRVKLTAELVCEKLNSCGIKAVTKLAPWLGSAFGNEIIQSARQSTPGTFSLFVTNAPYIKYFIYGEDNDNNPDPYYGDLFSKEFIIRSW